MIYMRVNDTDSDDRAKQKYSSVGIKQLLFGETTAISHIVWYNDIVAIS